MDTTIPSGWESSVFAIKDDPRVVKAPEEVVKEAENVVKAKTNVTKEFVKAYSGDIRSLFWLLSLPSLPNQRYNV